MFNYWFDLCSSNGIVPFIISFSRCPFFSLVTDFFALKSLKNLNESLTVNGLFLLFHQFNIIQKLLQHT